MCAANDVSTSIAVNERACTAQQRALTCTVQVVHNKYIQHLASTVLILLVIIGEPLTGILSGSLLALLFMLFRILARTCRTTGAKHVYA